jgi:7,8-dihydropterin-6-yl-methyl-4-(beta-D-ribofuranosyl)aminobenzene 5'-phosphate synthase
MTCTVLVENSTEHPALVPQHGLSLFLETGGAPLLLDFGQDDTFAKNAVALGKDISTVSAAVCSHAHYDHAGGFNTFCALNPVAPVYTYWRPEIQCYSTAHSAPGESPRFIGWNNAGTYENRICFADRSVPLNIGTGCWLVPASVHTFTKPYKNKTLYSISHGSMVHDDFSHECILAIETKHENRKGFALFNSCSHNGVINSIESFRNFFPGTTIFSYTGGFHFPWNKGEQIAAEDIAGMKELAQYAADSDIQLFTGHCTGEAALDYLHTLCGERLHRLHTGLVYSFGDD